MKDLHPFDIAPRADCDDADGRPDHGWNDASERDKVLSRYVLREEKGNRAYEAASAAHHPEIR